MPLKIIIQNKLEQSYLRILKMMKNEVNEPFKTGNDLVMEVLLKYTFFYFFYLKKEAKQCNYS